MMLPGRYVVKNDGGRDAFVAMDLGMRETDWRCYRTRRFGAKAQTHAGRCVGGVNHRNCGGDSAVIGEPDFARRAWVADGSRPRGAARHAGARVYGAAVDDPFYHHTSGGCAFRAVWAAEA